MLSFWEQKNFLHYDLIVVGAGFTGLSAAIHFKKQHKKAKVLVVDRGVFLLEQAPKMQDLPVLAV